MASSRNGFERSAIIIVGVFFLTGLLLFDLFRKQVFEHDSYAKAAQAQSVGQTKLQAERGRIYAQDKNSQLFPLSLSQQTYKLEISPRQVGDKQKLAEALHQELPVLATSDVFSKINNKDVWIPPLAVGLNEATAKRINDKSYIGVFISSEYSRIYPEADRIAAQILGFVGADSTGKYGVEATYDPELKGNQGSQLARHDSLGKLIDVLSNQGSKAGSDLVLTIDYNLQFEVEERLKAAIDTYKADSGNIIVMDPNNGKILAMAGQPTFDPNKYPEVKTEDQGRFSPATFSNIYEPGSVCKPITMAGAIEANIVAPDTSSTFGNSATVLSKVIKNAQGQGFGKETMTDVLDNSDNVAMVWVSSKMGADLVKQNYEKFGVSDKTNVDLVGEQTGRWPPKSEWNDLLRSTAAFGQGISMSVGQLARAYSVIANGGHLVTPHIAEKLVSDNSAKILDFPVDSTQVISADTASKVRQMLVSVVDNGHGKRAKVDGVKVGGKTGTAQVPDNKGGYDENKHIGTFAGMFPADAPKYVMVVRLDNPKTVSFAESSAAPTFGEIANWMTNYYQLR